MHAQALDSAVQGGTGRDHPILVVIQLAGGNDGLNTIIPFEDDLYFKARLRLEYQRTRLYLLIKESGFIQAWDL
jgi:uncharacterized protein (DUF1501 family)